MAVVTPFASGQSLATLVKPGLWLSVALLVVYFALSVYQDIDHLFLQRPSAPIHTQANRAPQKNTTMPAGQIASLNLFGVLGASASSAPSDRALPQTRLQLELKGTFTNSDSSRASALIAAKGKPAKRYKVNDSLPGGAKLHSVAADSVTISRGGNLEVLRYPKPKSLVSTRTTMSTARSYGRPPSAANTNGPVHGNGRSPGSRYGAGYNSRMR